MVKHAKFVQILGACLALISVGACGQDKTATPSATSVVAHPPTQAPVAGNTAPSVEVSAQLTRAAILQLNGSVEDETLPGGDITVAWSKVSGPADVKFGDPSVANTTATFTASGTYVLRLTATDGEFSATDDVTVVVQP